MYLIEVSFIFFFYILIIYAVMKLKDTCSLKGKQGQAQSIKKQRLTLPTKVHIVKAMVFPIVMYIYERQTIKKTES